MICENFLKFNFLIFFKIYIFIFKNSKRKLLFLSQTNLFFISQKNYQKIVSIIKNKTFLIFIFLNRTVHFYLVRTIIYFDTNSLINYILSS